MRGQYGQVALKGAAPQVPTRQSDTILQIWFETGEFAQPCILGT